MASDTKSAAEPKKVPLVTVRNRGKISGVMSHITEEVKKKFPNRVPQWVYAPQHKPDLSNVIARRAEGYEFVRPSDLGKDFEVFTDGDRIRFADVVLMTIDKDLNLARVGNFLERNKEIMDSIQPNYEENVFVPGDSKAQMNARGRISFSEEEFDASTLNPRSE